MPFNPVSLKHQTRSHGLALAFFGAGAWKSHSKGGGRSPTTVGLNEPLDSNLGGTPTK